MLAQVGGQVEYLLVPPARAHYWIPVELPPPGRERASKGDPDYWLESEQILQSCSGGATARAEADFIELLTAANPLTLGCGFGSAAGRGGRTSQYVSGQGQMRRELWRPGLYLRSKTFDPVPLRQTQPFKHNKKNRRRTCG